MDPVQLLTDPSTQGGKLFLLTLGGSSAPRDRRGLDGRLNRATQIEFKGLVKELPRVS